jgi:branched-chain amino acid transport system permease protein
VLATVLASVLDFGSFKNSFWDLTIAGLVLGSIYALIALGYTLVYGVLRLINFAHSEVFMLGTFGTLGTMWLLGIPNRLDNGDNPIKTGATLIGVLILCLIGSMLVSAVSAVVLEFAAYRPLRKRGAPRLVFLISAIGASFLLAEGVRIFGAKAEETYPIPRVFDKEPVFKIFGTDVRNDYLLVVIGAIVMMVLLVLFVDKTKTGRGIRAVAQDGETARLMGVNTDRIIVITFVVGGLMAGAAAFFFQMYNGNTKYNIGFALGVKAFTAAVLGGIGNLRGALLGGLMLGLIENYGANLFGGQKWGSVVAFVVLVGVLMFRPSGLLGETLGRARA